MNAGHDENSRPTLITASKNDGVTIVPIMASPTNHGLEIDDHATGTDHGNNGGNAILDENSVAVLTCLSSANDGSIVDVYGDPVTGAILVNSM